MSQLNRQPSRSAILEANDLVIEFCETPEWPCDVYVRGLTGEERDAFEGSLVSEKKDGKRSVNYKDIRAKLVARAACDEQGSRLFQDKDIEILTKKSAAALQRVFSVAQRLSGLSEKDVDELTENLKNEESADSTSD